MHSQVTWYGCAGARTEVADARADRPPSQDQGRDLGATGRHGGVAAAPVLSTAAMCPANARRSLGHGLVSVSLVVPPFWGLFRTHVQSTLSAGHLGASEMVGTLPCVIYLAKGLQCRLLQRVLVCHASGL